MRERLWPIFLCSFVSAFFHLSAMAMTCDELRTDIAKIEKSIEEDTYAFNHCALFSADCGDFSSYKASLSAAIDDLNREYKDDQAQMLTTCGPPPLPPRKTVSFDVSTYHYDALRTGWNNQESILTPGNVTGGRPFLGFGFGPLHVVPLDERVNAQPLLITHQLIQNVGYRDVVYVVTANNTVYAIDATTGSVLLPPRNLGQPVAGCEEQRGAPIGITSTPVIDREAQAMYLVAETLENGDVEGTEVDPDPGGSGSRRSRIDPPQVPVTVTFEIPVGGRPGTRLTRYIPRIPPDKHPVHKIYKLDLSTLTDKLSPKVISASHQLQDGTTYNFSPLNSRQRAGLVYANRSIYAAFTVACEDVAGDRSRGWLLGWDAATLAPLPGNTLTNSLEPYPARGDPPPAYLSGIWMMGFGVAADDSGSLFFVTSNGGKKTYGAPPVPPPISTTVSAAYNFANSVMKVSSDLTRVIDYFTPANVNDLDEGDKDFGAGGVLLMPNQPGSTPHLAVAAGKSTEPIENTNRSTPMFLLDRDHLGGFALAQPVPGGGVKRVNNVLGTYSIGDCFCGPSFFVGSDGTPRIVSSGGHEMMIWKVQTDPAPALVQEQRAAVAVVGDGIGFFTSVSSNGLMPDTAIIWAVHNLPVTLSAFNAATGAKIYSWPAGNWHAELGIYNIVPVVANGKVYVASDRQLTIFGLGGGGIPLSQFLPLSTPVNEDPNRVVGEVKILDGSRIILGTPEGSEIQVDASKAFENHRSIPFAVGSPITVHGRRDENGIIRADSITYAQPTAWGKK